MCCVYDLCVVVVFEVDFVDGEQVFVVCVGLCGMCCWLFGGICIGCGGCGW